MPPLMPDRAPKRGRSSSSMSKNQKGSSSSKQPPPPQTEPLGFGSLNFAEQQPLPLFSPSHPRNASDSFAQDLQPQGTLQSPHGQPPMGKLLLPPLPRFQDSFSSYKDKNRTAHACDTCRKAKAKCSGGQPCEKCKNERKECVYGDGKKSKERKDMDMLKSQYGIILERNEQLVSGLRTFTRSAILDPIQKRQLELLLESSASILDDDDENTRSGKLCSPKQTSSPGSDSEGAGSTASLDLIHEDTNRTTETRAAGFLGKSSAVSWVQRAKRAMTGHHQSYHGSPAHPINIPNESFTASAWYAEASDFPHLDFEINPLEWPEPSIADHLVEEYFNNIHSAFPVFLEEDFMETYSNFPRELKYLDPKQESWLSTLNLVFAIASKYTRLSHKEYDGDRNDHLIYYARACQLGIDTRTMHGDPEIEHTSCLAVLGLYLLCTDQLNRAWIISGVAIRHATALGLHVRSEAKDLSDTDKEIRIRLWWSLYTIERILAELTGRPSCISDQDSSTPMPINIDESAFRMDTPLYSQLHVSNNPSTTTRSSSSKTHGKGKASSSYSSTTDVSGSKCQPTTSITSPTESYTMNFAFPISTARLPITTSTNFIYRTSLSIISHEILTQLYCASLVKSKWTEVESIIHRLDERLQAWRDLLPPEYYFSPNPDGVADKPEPNPSIALKYKDERTALSICYHSAKMMLFRPTLCRFEGRMTNQSARSKSFTKDSVKSCVEAARAIIEALPYDDKNQEWEPQAHDFYTNISPFWQTLHYLIEAAGVLMLELAYRSEHVPSQASALLRDSKKAVLWLRALSDESIAARKGWEVFDALLRQVAPRVGGTTWDMPLEAPRPSWWGGNRFGAGEDMHAAMEHEQATGSTTPSSVGLQQVRPTRAQLQAQSQSKLRFPHAMPAAQRAAFDPHPMSHLLRPTWLAPTATAPQPSYTAVAAATASQGQEGFAESHFPTIATQGMQAGGYNFLAELQPFSQAGQAFGRYDEFGPWHSAFFESGMGQDSGMGGLDTGAGTTGVGEGEGGGGYMVPQTSAEDGGAGYFGGVVGGGGGGMDYDWSGGDGGGDSR